MLQVCVQSQVSQSMFVVILQASFPCRGPFSQRKAGHFDKSELMQLLCQGHFKISVLNVKRLFLITKLCMQQLSMTLTLSLILSSREQNSFSLNSSVSVVSKCRVWGYFSSIPYPVSFSVESLSDVSPIIHILMRPLAFLLHLIYIV